MDYLVVFEQGPDSIGAYIPDLPGCVAVGTSLSEVRTLMREALLMHIEGLRDDGESLPLPTTSAAIMAVS